MAERNCEIDLQDFMTDDILVLMKNNGIGMAFERVGRAIFEL